MVKPSPAQQELMLCRRCNRTFPSGSFCTGCGGQLERYIPQNQNYPGYNKAADEQQNNVLLKKNFGGNNETDIQNEFNADYYEQDDCAVNDSDDFIELQGEENLFYDEEYSEPEAPGEYSQAAEETEYTDLEDEQQTEYFTLPTQGMVFEDISSNYAGYDEPIEENESEQYDVFSDAVTESEVADESVADAPITQSVEDYIEETAASEVQEESEAIEEPLFFEEPIVEEPV